ncbi:tRNA (adenosine(37)-N6)-dimethylallyltransferase MiaA [Porphyromonas sp. COT-290 OH860]|uniref:tRNA (adenosine(37)-N6)-dimethylallyltransferase MiaA n=1 Tax=Porphyromonas sp. COT-290 OH860 TaxID=1515615 RepID=UPI00052CEF23|nr:tRNA (adenosine(37)-N6)-dimethylallyltransferase MiaA [Porphyromonas sp. COT-290 OH860]KGN86022.1 tRNA delta(2)-isopentenylpyrophosphate transferase [Porphyromonas sp. COT-290 OH860]
MITIIGPTASGKTSYAAHLAHRLSSEIISADSRQVYRGMDLGTGKDLADYQVEGIQIPYHLIDIMPAGSRYNLFAYQHDFHRVYADMLARGIEHPILCGGTGMYVESVLRGYHLPDVPPNEALREQLRSYSLDELKQTLATYGPLHNKTDVDSAQRAIRAIEIAEYIRQQREQGIEHTEFPPIESLIICLDLSREARRERISQRLHQRLEEGMTAEVEQLLASGVKPEDLIYYGLEYKFVTQYVIGEIDYTTMRQQLEIAIHQFAKRQMTWFRGMERRGFTLHYLDALLPMPEKIAQTEALMRQHGYL